MLACVATAWLGGPMAGCEDTAGGAVRDRDRVRGLPRHEEEPGPTLVATGPSKEAMQRLTEATCARRARCGTLEGPLEACVERRRMDLVSEINNDACRIVDRARLDRCVTAIEHEGCRDPLGTIKRVIACRVGAFCSEGADDEGQ